MPAHPLCSAYLHALNEGNLSAVLSLFTPDAQVLSPLYGAKRASDFYRELFDDTNRSVTRLKTVFDHADTGSSIALHFEYDWTFQNGQLVQFECVDIFELTEDGKYFKSLKIIYDTAPLRADFERNRP